jgi:hypothetical protein
LASLFSGWPSSTRKEIDVAEHDDQEAACGHFLIIFVVLLLGAIWMGDSGVTALRMALWVVAIILTAFGPLIVNTIRERFEGDV